MVMCSQGVWWLHVVFAEFADNIQCHPASICHTTSICHQSAGSDPVCGIDSMSPLCTPSSVPNLRSLN